LRGIGPSEAAGFCFVTANVAVHAHRFGKQCSQESSGFAVLSEAWRVDITFNNLSLCTGGAGLDLGLQLALGNVRTVCCVEHEASAIEILAEAMEAGCLDESPIWTDLRSFDGSAWRGVVDTLTAGYPCQPFSLAGKRRGQDDPRHLWPHVARVVGEAEPGIVFLENVPGHLSLGFDQVARDLEGLGYGVAAGLFTAAEIGGSQKRERLFILALGNTRGYVQRREHVAGRGAEERAALGGASAPVGEPIPDELRRLLFPPGPGETDAWRRVLREDRTLAPAQSEVCLLADGLARDRAHWLRLLGNGVVPLQAAYAFCSLWAALRA
jgi:DNA (cytosine-5)-methyltransferase 1